MCTRTIYDARNNSTALVKPAEGGEPVELTRHDKPVAVIISYEDFKMIKPKKTFVQKMMELRDKYADVLSVPDWNGLEIPRDEAHEEEYDKKIRALWEEE